MPTFTNFRLPHRAELKPWKKKKKKKRQDLCFLKEIKVFLKYEEYTESAKSHNQPSREAIMVPTCPSEHKRLSGNEREGKAASFSCAEASSGDMDNKSSVLSFLKVKLCCWVEVGVYITRCCT